MIFYIVTQKIFDKFSLIPTVVDNLMHIIPPLNQWYLPFINNLTTTYPLNLVDKRTLVPVHNI
ncbi:hypothetical protein J2S13_003202 [Oikeobacillus pervagus]|uniref:Uncharacterized protein n=1 Tax=Oikeobacillus pervagus TaxID=1325931 RepID=A0AAJ1WKL0_9BACI|nr:hypothetical protein [Oikeobacillus pervagus]